jgi:hypothetical protein
VTDALPPGYLDYRPLWSNCRSWEHDRFHFCERTVGHGGYLVKRRGHNGVPWHFLHKPPGDHGRVFSYVPNRAHWSWKLLWSWHQMRSDWLFWFQGHVVEGDGAMWPAAHHEFIQPT